PADLDRAAREGDLHARVDPAAVEAVEDPDPAQQAEQDDRGAGAQQQPRVGGDTSGHRRSVYRCPARVDRSAALESRKKSACYNQPMATIDPSARLGDVLARYDALTEQMGRQEVVSDVGRLQELAREQAGLEGLATMAREWVALEKGLADARTLI